MATLSNGRVQNVDYRRPTYFGVLASVLLTALVIIGSRNLEHFGVATGRPDSTRFFRLQINWNLCRLLNAGFANFKLHFAGICRNDV